MSQYTSPSLTTPEIPSITLPDGRKISYFTYGPSATSDNPSPPTIIYLHGFPMSGMEATHLDALAHQKGLRIIAPSRPGYSTSTPSPNFTILSVTSDLSNFLSALQISTFAILASSGGAPYALSLATVLAPSRLKGIAIFSGLYPLALGSQGMQWSPWLVYQLAYYTPSLLHSAFDAQMGKLARDVEKPERFEHAVMHQMQGRPEVDLDAMKDPGIKSAVIEGAREAVRVTSEGAMREGAVLGMEWGFRLEDVKVKTWIWHGGLDGQAPANMARAAGEKIPGAEVEVLEKEGHVSVVLKRREMALDWLKESLLDSS
ncbi:alpha/beta hydrolase fold-containing protein 2 [Elsinoe australis]|uniref:Alpha/beta hydrolase fold-containing protein 2 n=1 Tax=Elsinoe australis TaxID=40998 RepID=A0A4U7BAG6_9PEZI|nr:alpha/beta hydrolase fold-containing protein 2 [Elsinoe australis]